MEFIFIFLSWMILLLPGFDDSVPPTGDKIFKIEYSDIVQSINTTSDSYLDFWGFDIKLKQNSEEMLDFKIPKNFPTPASYTGVWDYGEIPVVFSENHQIDDFEMIEDPCFFHYKIPIKGRTNIEIAYAVILAGTHRLYSPIEFDKNHPCYSEVFYEKPTSSPLKQFRAGIPIEEIQCKENLQLIIKNNGNPACVKSTSLEKLYLRGWGDCAWNCSHPIPENLIESEPDIPSDFSLVYYFGIDGKNIYDSKKNLLLADMVCDPPIELKIELSPQEKEIIWKSIEKNDFFSFTSFTQNCDESGQCLILEPEEFTTISVTANNKTHAVQHRGSYLYNDNANYLKFEEITQIIHDILRNREDNLPSPRCAYQ